MVLNGSNARIRNKCSPPALRHRQQRGLGSCAAAPCRPHLACHLHLHLPMRKLRHREEGALRGGRNRLPQAPTMQTSQPPPLPVLRSLTSAPTSPPSLLSRPHPPRLPSLGIPGVWIFIPRRPVPVSTLPTPPLSHLVGVSSAEAWVSYRGPRAGSVSSPASVSTSVEWVLGQSWDGAGSVPGWPGRGMHAQGRAQLLVWSWCPKLRAHP